MKTIHSLTLLMASAIGVLSSPTALADDDKTDLYLLGLQSENITLSDSTAIAAGHTVCSDFANGATQEEVVINAMVSTGLSLEDAGFLGGAAVYAFCPQFESRFH